MGAEQLLELKRLQTQNERVRRAVPGLTVAKLMLSGAARNLSRPARGRACRGPGTQPGDGFYSPDSPCPG
jgi:hypothetical protein